MHPSVDHDEIAALRAQHVEKLNTARAELQLARASLPEMKAAYDAYRDRYERLTQRVIAPLRQTESMPAATHAWLTVDAKAPLNQAQSAFRALERKIESLEEQLNKWADEVAYLDRVQAGDRNSSARLVVPQPKPRIVEFNDILMPRREETA